MAFVQYLAIATFGGLLTLAIWNSYLIFIRLKHVKNAPLLTFYLLSCLALFLRLWTLIMFVPINMENRFYIATM